MEAVDLDTLLAEPLRATIAGREYLFPAQLPHGVAPRVEYLQGRLEAVVQAEAPDLTLATELFGELYDLVLALARVVRPDLDDLPITDGQLFWFFRAVYAGQPIEVTQP
jgi:hypothetical protein